jgi:ppGpp synthetase/RelA/SpoT-type nucleotidyltranferase
MTDLSIADIEQSLLIFRASRRVIVRDLASRLVCEPAIRNPFLLVSRLFIRLKSADSVLEKMRRKGISISHPGELVDKIPDVLGARIIVETAEELHAVDEMLRQTFEVDSCVDHVRSPTEFGGREVGYTLRASIGERSCPFEVQVRTFLQHYWSICSFHLFHKQSPDVARRHAEDLRNLSEALESAERPAGRLGESAPTISPPVEPPTQVRGLEDRVRLVVVEPGERLADVVVLPLSGDDERDHERTVDAKLELYAKHPGAAIVEACCLNLAAFTLNEPHVRIPLDRIAKIAD